jgi:hypothetical protein
MISDVVLSDLLNSEFIPIVYMNIGHGEMVSVAANGPAV